MKPKLYTSLLIGLFLLSLFTGCMRNRLGNSGVRPAATASNPSAAAQSAPFPTASPAVPQGVTPVQQPTLATASPQPHPTDTVPTVQATATVPAAASQDVSKAADDLSTMLDTLTKDLNSADNLNDVK